MQYSILDHTQIEKLKNILSERYGKTLHIRQLSDISALRNPESPFFKGSDLHIPIQVNGSFLGTAVIPGATDLEQTTKNDMSALVKMILEPTLHNWYLQQRENNIRELSRVDVELDNVRLFADMTNDNELEEDYSDLNEKHSASLVSHIVHFHGLSSTNIKKAALQLHEITGRWAFVPFNDIKGQLHSSMDIARMGNMTIYIEEVSQLNEAEIELILNYLNDDVQVDTPLIITASTSSCKTLRSNSLNSQFVDELEINEFEMAKAPVEHNRLREVLELFFLKDDLD